ncbi:hypothetical protein B0H13DRAFT_1935806 [Mycena leptocephala]|nr:hypothetical protein B0H13DRAFT_1935806 [Mycena leptocephala]
MPQFLDGLHHQRFSMGYRLRTEALQFIPDDWDGTINVNTLFRENVVLETRLRFLRPWASRTQGAKGLFEGNSKLLQAKCHERIHKITHTTPGGSILSPALHMITMKMTGKAEHPRVPHPRIHATFLQAIQLPALIISSTIKPTTHHLPDAGHSSPTSAVRHPPVSPMGPSGQSSSRRSAALNRSHNNERHGR